MKTHFIHHSFKEWPLNTVIGFAHVKFEIHELMFTFRPRLKSVKSFIGYNNIICDKPTRDKGTLGRRNNIMEDYLESIC